MTAVLPPRAAELLEEARFARLATVTPTGGPHAAPFWFHWDGERMVVNTLESPTVGNIRRDDRVRVLVDEEPLRTGSPSLSIVGRARAYPEGEAPPPVRSGSEAIDARHAEELDTPEFAAYAERETRRVVIVEVLPEDLRVRRVGPPGEGGFALKGVEPVEPVRRMLGEAEVARLVTVGEDGWPSLETVWCRWDGDRLVSSTPSASAVDAARANPSVAVLVDLGTRFENLRGALIRGRAVAGPAGSSGGGSFEVLSKRVGWWDLARPEDR